MADALHDIAKAVYGLVHAFEHYAIPTPTRIVLPDEMAGKQMQALFRHSPSRPFTDQNTTVREDENYDLMTLNGVEIAWPVTRP